MTDSERLKAQDASRLLREARLLPATQAAQADCLTGARLAPHFSHRPPLSRTTYFFTEISFAAMIVSVACVATESNHRTLILAN